MKKLKEIASAYQEEGKGDMPAIIIQHATLAHQKIARGAIRDLPMLAEVQELSHPGLIIIGHVVDIGAY